MNSTHTGFDWEKNKPYHWQRRLLKTGIWSAAVRAVCGQALRKAVMPESFHGGFGVRRFD